MSGLIKNEFRKLVSSKKWLFLILNAALVNHFAFSEVTANAHNLNIGINIWDPFFSVMNNWIDIILIMLVTFIFLVADIILFDLQSGYQWIILTRGVKRRDWCISKAVFVAITALLSVLTLFFVSITLSFFGNLPFSSGPSDLAVAKIGFSLFPPISEGTNMLFLSTQIILYSSFVFFALGCLAVLVSLYLTKPLTTTVLFFIYFVVDFTLTQNLAFWRDLSLGLKIFFLAHFVSTAPLHSLSIVSSLVIFSCLLIFSFLTILRKTMMIDL